MPENPQNPLGDDLLNQDELDALLRQAAASDAQADSDAGDGPCANDAPPAPDVDDDAGDAAATVAPDDAAAMDQADIDALLSDADEEAPLDGADIDAVLDGAAGEEDARLDMPPASDDEDDLADVDALMSALDGAEGKEAADESPVEDGAASQSSSQDMIDALVAGAPTEVDAPGDPAAEPSDGDEDPAAGQDESAMADAAALASALDAEEAATANECATDAGGGALSQDLIDSLLAEAESSEELVAENLSAAVPDTEDDPDVDDSLVESLVAEAASAPLSQDDVEPEEESAAPAPAPAAGESSADMPSPEEFAASLKKAAATDGGTDGARKQPPVKGPGLLKRAVGKVPAVYVPKVDSGTVRRAAGSLAAGIVLGLATFAYLYSHRERTPEQAVQRLHTAGQPGNTLALLRDLVDRGAHDVAVREADEMLTRVVEPAVRAEANLLRLEAMYRALPGAVSARDVEELHGHMDDFVALNRDHPRVSEVLTWKADLYERTEMPHAARRIYGKLLEYYASAPDRDRILLRAGRLALAMGRPHEAADHLRRLLADYPGSRLAPEGSLYLADAYAEAGQAERAHAAWRELARTHTADGLGAKAIARLARAAMDAGNYDEAIRLVENRLETTVTTLGSDEAHVLLAEAHRGRGDLENAERTLRDLVDFFPDSPLAPRALVAFSQVLEDRGRPRDAVSVTRQAVARFPRDVDVLRHKAGLLERMGSNRAAAETLVKAVEAGADDPELLLHAARHFRRGSAFEQAIDTYDRLVRTHPFSPEAFDARIECAYCFHEQGNVGEALRRLTALADATQGRPQHLRSLLALGDLHRRLGFRQEAAGTFRKAASLTTDHEVVADSAIALFDAGAVDDGLAVARRVDPARLSDARAYGFLNAWGRALQRIDLRRAYAKMEEAATAYPHERTPQGDLDLLRLCLGNDQSARARAIVSDMEVAATRDPESRAHLVQASTMLADYLFRRRDYMMAADAYRRVMDAGGSDEQLAWAKFQRANALLKSADYAESIAIFDELAASRNPWANEAEAKARYARLEKRMRGIGPAPLGVEG